MISKLKRLFILKNLNNEFCQTRSQLEVKDININLLMCF